MHVIIIKSQKCSFIINAIASNIRLNESFLAMAGYSGGMTNGHSMFVWGGEKGRTLLLSVTQPATDRLASTSVEMQIFIMDTIVQRCRNNDQPPSRYVDSNHGTTLHYRSFA